MATKREQSQFGSSSLGLKKISTYKRQRKHRQTEGIVKPEPCIFLQKKKKRKASKQKQKLESFVVAQIHTWWGWSCCRLRARKEGKREARGGRNERKECGPASQEEPMEQTVRDDRAVHRGRFYAVTHILNPHWDIIIIIIIIPGFLILSRLFCPWSTLQMKWLEMWFINFESTGIDFFFLKNLRDDKLQES